MRQGTLRRSILIGGEGRGWRQRLEPTRFREADVGGIGRLFGGGVGRGGVRSGETQRESLLSDPHVCRGINTCRGKRRGPPQQVRGNGCVCHGPLSSLQDAQRLSRPRGMRRTARRERVSRPRIVRRSAQAEALESGTASLRGTDEAAPTLFRRPAARRPERARLAEQPFDGPPSTDSG